MDPHAIQYMRQRYPDPLRYIRPSFLTLQLSDLAVGRQALELIERKRCGPLDHTVYGEPPVSESTGLKALELFIQRRDLIRERLRNLAPRELTG
jgi:hypothetical protein